MDIVSLLLGIVILTIAIFALSILRTPVNPITVFCGVWSLILIVYSFRLYDLYQASEKTVQVIFTGVCFFAIGAFIPVVINNVRRPGKHRTNVNPHSAQPNYAILTILSVISLTIVFGFAIESFQLLRRGYGFDYIHSYYNTEEGIKSEGYLRLLNSWFVWPLTLASLPILAMCIQVKTDAPDTSKWKRLFIITSSVNNILYVLITGARANVAYFAIYNILLLLLQRRRSKMKLGNRIRLLAGGLATIFIINYMTLSRGSTSLLRTMYIYLCGCVPNLSLRLDAIEQGRFHGAFSLWGFVRPIGTFLNSLARLPGWSGLRDAISSALASTQVRVFIAPGTRYNAFLSPFFYFLYDGGMGGVIAFSFLYGVFCSYVFLKYVRKASYKYLSIYLLVLFGLFMSMVRFHFCQSRYVMAFVYVLISFTGARLPFTLKTNRARLNRSGGDLPKRVRGE